MDVLVSASPGGNSTSQGDISGQLNFSTRSLLTKMVVSPRVHLFVNVKEFKILPRQAQKQECPMSQGMVRNFICKVKSASEQDVLIIMTCPSKVVQ